MLIDRWSNLAWPIANEFHNSTPALLNPSSQLGHLFFLLGVYVLTIQSKSIVSVDKSSYCLHSNHLTRALNEPVMHKSESTFVKLIREGTSKP